MPDLYRKTDSTSSSEVPPPEIKIIQGTTRDAPEGAKVGQFCNAISGEVFDSFEFIFVDRDKTRTFWGRDTIEDEPPLCSSADADLGYSSDGKECLGCPNRLDNAASVPANIRKTKCLIHYTLRGIRLPSWEPFMMRITGVSTSEFMRLLSFFLYNQALRNKSTNKPDYHTIVIPVTTVQIKSPAGMSYGLKFGTFKPLDTSELITAALTMSAEMLGQGDALLALEEGQTGTRTEQDAKTLYEGNKQEPPKVNVIPSQPAETLVGYLETDGREIYAGDLVPAGTRVLKDKPVIKEKQTVTAAEVGKVETVVKPPVKPPTGAPQAVAATVAATPKAPAKTAQIDIGSL